MKNEYPIVLIEWADACGGDPGWFTLDDIEDDGETIIQSVGFLIPADEPPGKKDHITLLQSYHDGDGIHLFWIPIAMVRKTIVLTPCN